MPTLDFTLTQGADFSRLVRWYAAAVDSIFPIDSITPGYPTTLTVTGHGLPASATPVALLGDVPAVLLTASAAPADRIVALAVDTDNFTVDLDSTDADAYSTGGYLQFTPPVDLSGYTARMQIRRSIGSEDFLIELTDGAGLTLDAEGGVTIALTAAETEAFTAATAVYDLEVESGGVVTRLFSGRLTLSKEITR